MGRRGVRAARVDLHPGYAQLLRDLGVGPASDRVRRAIGQVRDRCTWGEGFGFGDSPFFEGEVEPCINGRVLAIGAYFGEPSDRLVDRLLQQQLSDGGLYVYGVLKAQDARSVSGSGVANAQVRDVEHDGLGAVLLAALAEEVDRPAERPDGFAHALVDLPEEDLAPDAALE